MGERKRRTKKIIKKKNFIENAGSMKTTPFRTSSHFRKYLPSNHAAISSPKISKITLQLWKL